MIFRLSALHVRILQRAVLFHGKRTPGFETAVPPYISSAMKTPRINITDMKCLQSVKETAIRRAPVAKLLGGSSQIA